MKENKLSREVLLCALDDMFYGFPDVHSTHEIYAYEQIKECIHKSYKIPDTSEREAELEEIIIKMQGQLNGYETPIPESVVDKYLKYQEYPEEYENEKIEDKVEFLRFLKWLNEELKEGAKDE